MPRFLVERDVPRAHALKATTLREIAQKSCAGITEVANGVRWIESFVLQDRIVCVFEAPDEAAVAAHARKVNFPAQAINEVISSFDPSYAAL